MNKRPFFSIIVPCYNSKKTIGRLLKTIVEQNMNYDDIEVILSDDCSTESYQDQVDKFKDRLYIKQTKTDYNCCPGNTRQKGVDIATGQWIVFADHDDQFVPNVFLKVKQQITRNECQSFLNTRFIKVGLDGKNYEMSPAAGWTHGKFFNLDNFWKKYNFHFIKDMKTHQDVSIMSLVNYLQKTENNLNCCQIELVTYKWHENKHSLTSIQYETADGQSRHFIDAYFLDYFAATAEVYYNNYCYKNKPEADIPCLISSLLAVILYSYFYLQYAYLIAPFPLKENYDKIKQYLDILHDEFNIDIGQINYYFTYQHQQEYKTIFESSLNLSGVFLCQHSFKQFLDTIYNQKYIQIKK